MSATEILRLSPEEQMAFAKFWLRRRTCERTRATHSPDSTRDRGQEDGWATETRSHRGLKVRGER